MYKTILDDSPELKLKKDALYFVMGVLLIGLGVYFKDAKWQFAHDMRHYINWPTGLMFAGALDATIAAFKTLLDSLELLDKYNRKK